jgi:hypothetical protein
MESLEQTNAGIRFKAPKNNRHRVITLPGYAVEELRRLKRQRAEELLALGACPDYRSGEAKTRSAAGRDLALSRPLAVR